MEEPNSPLAVPKLRSVKGRKTRRFHGRRAVTPMRRRHHRHSKTRAQPRIGKGNGVQLSQRTSSSNPGERSESDKDKHGEHQERQGDENGDSKGERKDQEEHAETNNEGSGMHSEVSVHPGSLQELRELPASIQVTDETSLEEEEPPF